MDSLFFIASKVLRPLLYPSSWIILLFVISWIAHRLQRRKWANLSAGIGLTLLLLIGFYPVGSWLAYPLEKNYALPVNTLKSPDGIIVLGGAWLTDVSDYWQQWELNHAAERELAFIALARRFPDAKLVFTGGSGRLFASDLKEAHIAQQLYSDLGLDPERILLESSSRNTYENALLSKALVQPQKDEDWWLITSAYHLPRSTAVFCQQGWDVTPYPVDHFFQGFSLMPRWSLADHLWELERVSQEWFGLLVYRLTGKSRAVSASGC